MTTKTIIKLAPWTMLIYTFNNHTFLMIVSPDNIVRFDVLGMNGKLDFSNKTPEELTLIQQVLN